MKIWTSVHHAVTALVLTVGLMAPALAADSVTNVGKQVPINILINASPWYGGFEKVTELYQKQTGNKVSLDVTPYNGMLEKARNAVRGDKSPYDILNIDTAWTIEFYKGGFLKPLTQIQPGYAMPKQVFTCGGSYYWNAQKQWRTPVGGELMAVPPNCNTQVLVYRKDLFKAAKLAPPKTFDEVLDDCKKLQKPGLYGYVTRGERGNGIWYDFLPFLYAYGGSEVADPENGDFTSTLNSPKALAALDKFIEIEKTCAPANRGAIGQADVIQLMATGNVAMAQVVIAAWPYFENPTKSVVVGKIAAVENPSVAGGKPGVPMGNWHFAVPKNIPEANQKAALAFMEWFLTKDAQMAYAKAGGIPVRSDVMAELSKEPKYAWMAAYKQSLEDAVQPIGYAEGAAVEDVMGLRLNQALIGQKSPAAALNTAAAEIEAIFKKNGRKTGHLPPLPQ